MTRLTDIKKHHEKTLRGNLINKNDQLNHVKSEYDKRKREIIKELTKMMSELEVHTTDCEHSVRFTRSEINDDLIESLRSVSTRICHHKHQYRSTGTSQSGISQSVDGGLQVTLREKNSDPYKLDSHSRRLVRHMALAEDVIHEYEYQEDGHTRLFTWPFRVTQNNNSDICVVNQTSDTTSNLVIISPTGRTKLIYCGQNLTENFNPGDVVCDSFCNILVTDPRNNQIHLLIPDGEFLKFLLTENEAKHPYSLSPYKSTLWVGYHKGLVKIFKYTLQCNM
ncbi:uncharacterized protein LOC133193017 [Saccostrea echinata]|uniref:uncharacterized protein LOC133193017 n=1 Tax=Saccostrea echinata TaxID=191078 RepID=UPI002A819D98|nr:uncharacterized protein LOC133193017 [Saccostrea echinata]